MISNPIFKKDTKGNIRTWQYEVDGGSYRTIAGLQDGKKVESAWTVCTPKSQPTAELQAQFEGAAEQQKKLDREYHPTLATIDTPNFFKPMLAQTYDGAPLFVFNTYAQPKLDGIRCIATVEGLFSRQGKPLLNAQHIIAALAGLFEVNPDLILDGELYNHDLKDDFNQITSLVRKQKPKADEAAKAAELIQFHVYDLPHPSWAFSQRLTALANLNIDSPHIKLVETFLVTSVEELDLFYARWIEQGYEGQMVRIDGRYEQKRSDTLLKRKEFKTEEFMISKIIEGIGNWAGYAKAVEFMLPDDHRLDNGERPKSGLRGNQDFAKALLARADEMVGKTVTVRFFDYTPDGIPRFPVAIDFDRQD